MEQSDNYPARGFASFASVHYVEAFFDQCYRANLNSLVYEDYVDYQSELAVDDIANKIEYDEFIRELKRALGTLPATQRKVIELSRLHELSNKEIAQELSLSEQTVKNQLSLGLKALRSELKRFPAILFLLSILN